MSGGFSFPPPPPPPTKPQNYSAFNLGHTSASDRGRGRGRGPSQYRGPGPGHFDGGRNSGGQRDGSVDLGSANGFAQNGPNTCSNPQYPSPNFQQQSNQSNNHYTAFHRPDLAQLPPGSYVNPRFRGFDADKHDQHDHNDRKVRTDSFRRPQEASGSPQRTFAGHKRKLDVLRGQEPRVERSGPQTAPPVPNFGEHIVPARLPLQSNRPDSGGVKADNNKNAGRSLFGIGASHDDLSDSESDDGDKEVDEEAMFAELGTKLIFEYEGAVMSLNSAADLAKWQQERRKRWPTNARVAESQAERRKLGEERRRLLESAAILSDPLGRRRTYPQKPRLTHEAMKELHGQSSKDTERVSDETQRTDFERNEASYANMEAAEDPPTSTFKPLPGINLDDSSEDESSSQAAGVDNVDANLNASGLHIDTESDNEPPEESTSKAPPTCGPDVERPACRYFFASGRCRDGDACRFRHEAAVDRPFVVPRTENSNVRQPKKISNERKSKRKSIHQLLVDQEQNAANRLTLQVIRYLGDTGLFRDSEEY